MSDSPGALPVEFDDQNRIAADLPCVECDYNLRTQPRDGRCPECGATVQRAILVARLRLADPAWLRSISYSVFWLTIGLGVLLGAPLLGWFEHDTSILLAATVTAVPPVTLVMGLWQATRREPHRRARFADALRGISRWGLTGGVVILFAMGASAPLAEPWLSDGMLFGIISTGLALLIIGTLSGLTVGLIIASRVQSRALMTTMSCFIAAAIMLGTPLLLVILVDLLREVAWELEMLLSQGGNSPPITHWLRVAEDWLELFPIQWTGWAFWLLGVLFLPLLFWYRHRLRDAAGAAQRRVARAAQNTATGSVVSTDK